MKPSHSLLARRSTWLLASVAASVVSLAPTPAQACGACGCFVPYGVRPGNLRDDAPRNMRFLIALEGLDAGGRPQTVDPADITWTDADGAPIEFDIEPTDGSGNEVWLVPSETLPENTEFEINVIDSNGASTTMFGTGAVIDLTPPTASGLNVEPIEGGSAACGAFHGARLTWADIQDDHDPIAYDAVVRLDVTLGEDSIVLYTSAAELYPGRGLEIASPADDESAACWGQVGLPFGTSSDTLTVTATIYDAAGNPLEMPPVEVPLGDSAGASCEPTDGGTDSDAQRGGGMCSIATPGHGMASGWGWLLVGAGILLASTRPLRRLR